MKIAFYLNLQGAGHCRRFEAIAQHLPSDCELAVMGMNGLPPISDINQRIKRVSVPGFAPPSTSPFLQQQTSPDYHGLAVNRGGNAAFTLAMVSFLSEWQPDLLVVDVGLEASILARMCGIPTVYSRQHGRRWDKGHTLAYEWACGLLAPFSEQMEQDDCPQWIREKTFYSGGFCRFSGRRRSPTAPTSYAQDRPNVLVMTGFGGTEITGEAIARSALANPQWRWHLLGNYSKVESKIESKAESKIKSKVEGVVSHGVVEDVWPYLCRADLVVANVGHNSTMEIAAAGVPSVCIPAWRHFDEQICKAQVLARLGLSVVVDSWPQADAWLEIWEKSRSLSAWASFQDAEAPKRAAQYLAKVASDCIG